MTVSILVVEDSESVRYLYKEMMSRMGIAIAEAEDGESAIVYLQENAPDFIILDMLLPRIQGTQVLEYIYRMPHLRNTCVIIISAHEKFRQLQRRPGDHFILKPVTLHQLRAIIKPVQSSVSSL